MLDLANIPVLAKDRENDFPFVVAGGPCACNPAPLEDFIDVFMMGEGEVIINKLAQKYVEWKEKNFLKSII